MKFNIKALGPGLIWAAAAIGVSHLVQSTRAGANYGFELVWFILLINLVKYPFFQFGPRYAAATGESMLHGFKRLGNWAVWLFMILTVLTMFGIQAGVTIVTASLFSHVFQIGWDVYQWTFLLLVISGIIVYVGRFSLLDKIVKVIIVALSLTTIFAVVSAIGAPGPKIATELPGLEWDWKHIAFLIALAGWMPSAVDITVWHSFWTLAKQEATGHKPSVKESLFDFNVGYIATAVLAIGFLSLGALVMHGSGESFSSKGGEFSAQLINMYTSSIGDWSYWIIAIAALTTMFSTTLTVMDAYPRVIGHTLAFYRKPSSEAIKSRREKWIKVTIIASLTIVTYLVIRYFATSMQWMVDLATTLSFLTAPVLAYLTLRVMKGKNVPDEAKPGKWLLYLSWIGIGIMSVLGILYLVWRFFLS